MGSLAPCSGRRVGRERAAPFLVHAREVRRIAEEEGHADDLVERAAGRIEDRLDFGQALPRLLHDGRPDDGPGRRIERALPWHETESGGLYRLTVIGGLGAWSA